MKENIEEVIEYLDGIDIKFFLSGMAEQSNYIVGKANEVNEAVEILLSDYKRVLEENEELKEGLFMLKTKTKRQKIKDLECHCGECDDEIYRICEQYCSFQDDEVALCERERFANMDIEDYEKIEKTLRIEKKMEDIIEKLQKENEELKYKYDKALNDLVNTEKGTISKQKIKDKIEELKSYKGLVIYERCNYESQIKTLQDLLEKKGE